MTVFRPELTRKPHPSSNETQLPPPYVLESHHGEFPKSNSITADIPDVCHVENTPHSKGHLYRQGESVTVALTLFGNTACNHVKPAAQAMVLGLDNRFVETGFLRVVAVRDGYGVTSSHDRPEGTSSLRRCWPACFACPAKGAGVRLCLSTPLLLSKTSQQADHTFTFDQLFNNIIRRYKTIALHYGDSEPIAPKRLTEQASKVSISDKHVFSVAYSQRLCSPGILGHVDFVGDITPFIPWLELGSLLHIGKKLSMGYGAFQLKYLD